MIWKTSIILIYFLLSVSVSFGLINSGIQQADYNGPIEISSNEDQHGNYCSEKGQAKGFWWPNQNGVNIANINGGTGYINQNIKQNCLVDSYQSVSTKLMPVSGIGFNEHASYTINFFNINYGLLRDKSEDPWHRSRLQRYPPSMKEALKRSAENARILEKDRKENIQLLKRIAS
jgi:hypothetical protein